MVNGWTGRLIKINIAVMVNRIVTIIPVIRRNEEKVFWLLIMAVERDQRLTPIANLNGYASMSMLLEARIKHSPTPKRKKPVAVINFLLL